MIKKISNKKKLRLAFKWSESDLFKKRFNQLKSEWRNYCMVTGKVLTEDMLSPASFPHILPKWKFPQYRYYLNNIWLVCWIEEHDLFDKKINKLKEEKWLFRLEEKIKNWEEIILDIPLI